jgi:hypothetical protein
MSNHIKRLSLYLIEDITLESSKFLEDQTGDNVAQDAKDRRRG